MTIAACYPTEPSPISVAPNEAIPRSRIFQAEVSAVAIPPGNACAQGAVFAGFNDTGDGLALPYVTVAGLTSTQTPAACPTCAWDTRSADFLGGIVRSQQSSVRALLGDPILARAVNDRVLYASMGSSSDDGAQANRLVVFRSDDCGASWATSIVPLEIAPIGPLHSIDRPSLWVDPSNRSLVLVGVTHEINSFYSFSLDGGTTFSPELRLIPRPPGGGETPWFVRIAVNNSSRVGAVIAGNPTPGSSSAIQYYFTSTSDPVAGSWTPLVPVDSARRLIDNWSGDRSAVDSPRGDRQPTVVSTGTNILVSFPAYFAGIDSQIILVRGSTDGGNSWKTYYSSLDGAALSEVRPVVRHDASWPVCQQTNWIHPTLPSC